MIIILFIKLESRHLSVCLSDYFSKCESIDDIMQYARGDIGRLVMFSEDDDISLTFKERFQSALVGTQYMVDVNRTEEDSDKVENQPSD